MEETKNLEGKFKDVQILSDNVIRWVVLLMRNTWCWCPIFSDIWARSTQWLDKSWRSTWPVWPTNTKCEYIFSMIFPRLCHPLALASIFTRRIYSLPWCAPGQSQIWENNLFELKLFNDDGYLVFNCKNWLEISMFVYFCRLGCIKHCERKGKVFACLDSIGWHGQCRKFAGICTLTSDGAFSKSPKTNKATFFLWKWKLKKQKVGLPSYRRIQGWNSRAECLRRTTKERLGLSKRDTWKFTWNIQYADFWNEWSF